MGSLKRIQVVAAIFINERSEVFCARRKNYGDLALKWEFPGGKIEAGESHIEALEREIKEELEVNISVTQFFMTVDHDYDRFSLQLHTYFCSLHTEDFYLSEHEECAWVHISQLGNLDWAEADLPIVNELMRI
ncbi:MAG: 8-oxo-dGTP diphosphatase MutT [Firmicutes bacterium]|nr:8-oxo-dGTP diphosphatase MutT [Bacillota bacterium]